jgi:hypothetical protein
MDYIDPRLNDLGLSAEERDRLGAHLGSYDHPQLWKDSDLKRSAERHAAWVAERAAAA